MDNIFNNIPITISIIDYLGKMNDGVGLLLSLVADDKSYEIAYWYNKEGQVRIVPEPKLLNLLGVDDIYDYKYINELIYFIHNNIKNPDDILNEFLK